MKRLSFLLLFLPVVCFGESLQGQIANNYDWSISITSDNDAAWQIYCATTSNRKTVFVTSVDLASDKGGYFTIYSTNVARTSFTGSKTGRTVSASQASSGITSISSATTCTDASAPTGEIRWQGIVGASETYKVLGDGQSWALTPGKALYVIKTNGAAGEIAAASFRLVETYK